MAKTICSAMHPGISPAVGGGEWILKETDCENLEQYERDNDHRLDDLSSRVSEAPLLSP
jgi:hypothetical protein